MQTFLPYESFHESAKTLDYRRLGKQRVETWQIARVLLDSSKTGWAKHPAVLMWKGYELALLAYGVVMCNEWIVRGYNDTMLKRFVAMIEDHKGGYILPSWLGDPGFHASHRSNLLRKDFTYYSQFNWTEPNNLEYVWPSKTSIRTV